MIIIGVHYFYFYFYLAICPIVLGLVLTLCSSDYSMHSSQKLCVSYLNAGPLSAYQWAKKAELEKRDITTCAPYEAEAERKKAQEPNFGKC